MALRLSRFYCMAKKVYAKIVALVRQAAQIAKGLGITNLLQPGLVKEMVIADILEHELIFSKRDADACARGNPSIKYEYLSCKEGGLGQLDRMFKSPPEKRARSLTRISRNQKIYLAVFFEEEQMHVKVIYEISPGTLKAEAERQLNNSRNEISHIGISECWAKKNGKVVYPKKGA